MAKEYKSWIIIHSWCMLKHAWEEHGLWSTCLCVCVFFQPEVKLVDPICTFLFSLLVLTTTLPVLRDATHILMEGFPRHLDYTAIATNLHALDGVRAVHNLHVWSLTLNKNALAVHLAVGELARKLCAQNIIRFANYYFCHHIKVNILCDTNCLPTDPDIKWFCA